MWRGAANALVLVRLNASAANLALRRQNSPQRPRLPIRSNGPPQLQRRQKRWYDFGAELSRYVNSDGQAIKLWRHLPEHRLVTGRDDFDLTPFFVFLLRHLDRLKPLIRHAVSKRVALNERRGSPDVQRVGLMSTYLSVIDLPLLTWADHVGACAAALRPLDSLIEQHVMAAERLHGDDTPVPIRAKGKTDTGWAWVAIEGDADTAFRYRISELPLALHSLWRSAKYRAGVSPKARRNIAMKLLAVA